MRSNTVKAPASACMPRLLRGGCRASTARPAASVSLLERIRDVVLRLIMLSAVSTVKRSGGGKTSSSSSSSSPRAGGLRRERPAPPSPPVACRRDDSIRNEAIEDCIEFLKRSSTEGDAAKLSSVTAAETASVVRALVTTPSSTNTTNTVTAHGDPAKPPSTGTDAAAVASRPVITDVEVSRRSTSPTGVM